MGKILNFIENIKKYIQGVRTELKRVSWPTKQELRASTIVVLITLIIVTTYLWLCDSIFIKIFGKLRQF